MKIYRIAVALVLVVGGTSAVAACRRSDYSHCYTEDGTYDDDLAADCPDDDPGFKKPKAPKVNVSAKPVKPGNKAPAKPKPKRK